MGGLVLGGRAIASQLLATHAQGQHAVWQRIRYLALLVDEVARGKKMTSILRRPVGRPTDQA